MGKLLRDEFCQPHLLARKSFSPHIIPKTKGLEESLHEHVQMTFLVMVTEGLVQGVYKVVTRSCFAVILQHKVSGGKWTFRHGVIRSHTNIGR